MTNEEYALGSEDQCGRLGGDMEHQDLIGSLGAMPSSPFWYLHHELCL